ncbi:ArsR/SmtB family transcription factor [Frondihabitans australicus]|uniref:DNA-binding transcriptional ArsR family regulator n=1 Tax=Frondihabitans australicus TaxID=386892 RepID=A0A495IHL9_9MICO|nr:winged helix-turn-helix transcriptional regulator [Frondihabitans australicus]RKR75444.1 DNA-binding transcriptional ArsR family regulator [Frondihabitans australicus]
MTLTNESPSKRPMTAFEILGEPLRLFLIETLCVGAQTSGELAELAHERFGVSWSAVSRQLVTLRRSGFVRFVPEETTRWYMLEDDWLDLVTGEVESLQRCWHDHREHRGYGFPGLVRAHTDWPPDVRADHRGRRGRTARNRAARGADRSIYVHDADGEAGLE